LNVVLIHFDPVKSLDWSTKTNHLVIATNTSRIFIWSVNGASVCDIPLEGQNNEIQNKYGVKQKEKSQIFKVNKVKWNPDGKSILIQDKSNLLVAYPHFTFLEEQQPEGEYNQEGEGDEEVKTTN